MSTQTRLPTPSGRNKFMLGRIISMGEYFASKRGQFMMRHSAGSAVRYGGIALAMLIFVCNFKPILGRIPYIKQSYELPKKGE